MFGMLYQEKSGNPGLHSNDGMFCLKNIGKSCHIFDTTNNEYSSLQFMELVKGYQIVYQVNL
jgi:hypothetical protein